MATNQLPAALEVTSDVTIYGDGTYKLKADTGDNGRVINVNDNTEGPVTLTLSGVDIVGPSTGSNNRGVTAYGNSDLTIVMDNCSASANYYALYIASENKKVNVTVRNSTLTGYSAFETFSPNTTATFENCVLTGVNQRSNASGATDNDHAVISIDDAASGANLTFTNCVINSNTQGSAKEYVLESFTSSANVTFDGCEFYANGTAINADGISEHLYAYGSQISTFK